MNPKNEISRKKLPADLRVLSDRRSLKAAYLPALAFLEGLAAGLAAGLAGFAAGLAAGFALADFGAVVFAGAAFAGAAFVVFVVFAAISVAPI